MEGAPISYDFTFDQKKNLSPQEQSQLVKVFKSYDTNKDGVMSKDEFKNIMVDLGYRKITDDECAKMLAEFDTNQDGVIQWGEFIDMMNKFKGQDEGKFGAVTGIHAKIVSKEGGIHSYNVEERAAFAKLINVFVKEDADLADRIPMKTDDDTLFHAFDNGVLMCKLLLKIDPNVIDARAINKMQNMNVYQVQENLKMGLAAAKGLGIKLIGIDSNDFIKKVPHQILTFVWQVLRILSAASLNLKDTPELMRLAQEGEELKDLQKLPAETILIRWMNYHLKKAGSDRVVSNLGKDLADSHALMHVLNQLDSSKCPLEGIDNADLEARANHVITNALALGVPDLISPSDITKANVKVMTLFVAAIFNTKHGLEDLTAEEYQAAAMIDDDAEGSREERSFRLWINSLGIPEVHVDNLYDAFNDGVLINKLVDAMEPGSIDWSKIDLQPKNDFGKNINNTSGVKGCTEKLKIKLIGVGGPDLTKGDKKSILACVWQIARYGYLKVIGNKTEDDVVKWANELVGDKYPPIKDLKDKSLADGRFLLHLCTAIEGRAVNWELVQEGANEDEQKNNAKYVLSVARKLEAVIFSVWEDLVNVHSKQMLIFFATMYEIQQNYGKQ